MIDNDDSKNSVFLSFSTFIILQRIETILELLTEPQRRTVDDLMGVALTDMKGDDLAVLGITVERCGADVERTEAALACTVRTGYDGELWTAFHYFAMR